MTHIFNSIPEAETGRSLGVDQGHLVYTVNSRPIKTRKRKTSKQATNKENSKERKEKKAII